MYCQQCETEYQDRFTVCPECHMALAPGVAPEAGDPNIELVTIFESSDPVANSFVRGSLEESGIPFYIEGHETTSNLLSGPILFPLCRFLVAEDREAEARELLRPMTSPQKDNPSW